MLIARRRFQAAVQSVSLSLSEFTQFLSFLLTYSQQKLFYFFGNLEQAKNTLVSGLLAKRGQYATSFVHSGMSLLIIFSLVLAPVIANSYEARGDWQSTQTNSNQMLGLYDIGSQDIVTTISKKTRDRVIDYQVKPGDTVSAIARKFGISSDTIRWANNLKSINSIRPGQTLKILPVSGVVHKVKRGESVYSIAKKYGSDPQAIVDFPFNEFTNDETFALAVGQNLIVPDGVMPSQKPWSPPVKQYLARTPSANSQAMSGQFIWPTTGRITQRYSWYHRGLDIANKSAPPIAAADSGRVIGVYRQRWAYGKHVVIDHGNGFVTLYAHLSKINVSVGQSVAKGEVIGRMGSTGRSTGTHLHFEIRKNGAQLNPLNFLK